MTNEELIKIVRYLHEQQALHLKGSDRLASIEQAYVRGLAQGYRLAADWLDSHIPPEAYEPQEGINVQVGKWYRTYDSRRVRCTGTGLSNWLGKEELVYYFHFINEGGLYAQLDDRGRDCQGNQIIMGEVEV